MVQADAANNRQLVGILLAAGRGARFDPSGAQNKLMQRLPDGAGVAVTAARTLLSALPQVLAVVRPGANELGAALRAVGCTVVTCPDADQGMGASLVFALSHVSDAAGWVIALADMPYVDPTSIAALMEALNDGADIVAPSYQGQRGNPVGLSRKHLAQLMTLGGDQGARSLLKMHAVTEVTVDDVGILRDIDTAQDLV
ncbi:MAG TPA: nucleotidyltransferase family protein [Burkholderiaceae bacterium]|jgi:molybdenum cofactor cytidylyltransferase|nr:nucleotidyltransferase family protein [Burkholderiaceae bacterium]